MTDALGTEIDTSRSHPEDLDETTDRSLEIHPLAIVLEAGRDDPPRIMRLVHGTVRDGGLEAYIAAADAGTRADMATGQGPLALYLAPVPPDRFVTLSIWSGWDSIEASTGAGTKRPEATRHAERLADARVEHYEIVPR